MLVNDYVLPFIANVDGKLVFDQNSGYTLGKMIADSNVVSNKLSNFDWEILNESYISSDLVMELANTTKYKVFGFYSYDVYNVDLDAIILYIDNKIHFITNCESICLLNTRLVSLHLLKGEYNKLTNLFLTLYDISSNDMFLLNLFKQVMDLNYIHILNNKLFVMCSDVRKQYSIYFCYIIDLITKEVQILEFNGKELLKIGETTYYITQDIKTKHFNLLVIGDNLIIQDLGYKELLGFKHILDLYKIKVMCNKDNTLKLYFEDEYIASFDIL